MKPDLLLKLSHVKNLCQDLFKIIGFNLISVNNEGLSFFIFLLFNESN